MRHQPQCGRRAGAARVEPAACGAIVLRSVTFSCTLGYMEPPGEDGRPGLLASNADRDAAASVINDAVADGRLTAEEHLDRLDAIYSARRQAELVAVIEDLPARRGIFRPAKSAGGGFSVGFALANMRRGWIAAVLGATSRRGAWLHRPVLHATSIFGLVRLDFRDSTLPDREIVLHARPVLGAVSVLVPPEMRVTGDSVRVRGGRPPEAALFADATGPVLRIERHGLLGSVRIHRRPSRRDDDQRQGRVTVSVQNVQVPVLQIRVRGRSGRSED